MTLGGERRRLALTKVRPAGEQRRATSLCSLGAPQQVAVAPSPGKPRTRGGAGRRRRSRTARGRRGSARTAGDRGGAWGPRGGGAASLGAAPGRGLCVALLPLARSAESESPSGFPGASPPPSGLPGADLAPPLPSQSSADPPNPDRPSEGACAANGPVLPAFLCPAAWEVRPSYAVSREEAGMTATGWARTMANSTAVRVSGPNVPPPPTPGFRPLPFLSHTAQAHPTLVPLGLPSSLWVCVIQSLVPGGCLSTTGVS